MTQYISKSAVVAEMIRKINRCKKILLDIRTRQNKDYYQGMSEAYKEMISFLSTLEMNEVDTIHPIDDIVSNDPISKDLEEEAENYPSIIRTISQQWEAEVESAFIASAKWQKGKLWKNAQGDDLPEIDREVVVLYEPYRLEGSGECAVGFAHRPPERWYGRNLDGEEHVFEPKTYDKGKWNIPNVVWWLDLDLPIKGK
jgi:hypothetical protein